MPSEKCLKAASVVTGIPEDSLHVQEDYGKYGCVIQDRSSIEYYVEPTYKVKAFEPELAGIVILGEHDGWTVYKEQEEDKS
ncbi:hypothetical protein SAMN02799624_05331 [Paenibacillus sp. UNC496MF]|uniref:hypothetical protein n=1 Tax=Paenibacillus sp. UNC496MF TaxID=1502753 RepID=UPI0008E344BC|nr:hypothetical protein [Paenibacillus sp. UNC496MF]SFJ64282.1 hypothetical protein SAMN02799624_05331 [Paenibacillus sp. UNC496MF]